MPSLDINDSGTWRTITYVGVNDSGTWRTIQEVWVNDSGTWRLVFVYDTYSFSNQTVTDFNTGAANAIFEVNSNGTYNGQTSSSGTTSFGNWVTPTSSAGNYEVRATITSGSLTGGTTGSWLPLTSTRNWSISILSGAQSCTMTVEIRRVSDLSVVASASITINATAI